MSIRTTKFKETEIGTIPEEWEVSRLGDLVEKIIDNRGKTPPLSQNGYELLEVNAIKAEERTPNYSEVEKFVNEETYKNWFRTGHIAKNDLIIPTVGTIGNLAISSENRGSIAQNLIALRINKNSDPVFVYYILSSPNYKEKLLNLDIGGVQPSIKVPHLMNLQVPIPRIKEQQEIAEILSSLDDKIELNHKINVNLEKLASSLFKQWFVDFEFPDENGKPYKSSGGKMIDSELENIPEEWKVSIMGKEFETFLGGTPSRAKNEYWTSGTVPWINSGMVNEYRITEASEYITEEAVKNSATKLLPKGTVVIAITGATLGQYSLLEIDSSFNQSVIGIKENKNFKKEFIYYWIATTINTLINSQTGGAQQHINKQVVDSHKILIPDQNTLNKYYEIVGPIFEFISSNCFEIKNLSALRNSLLPQLMNGKIRVNI